MDSLTSLIYGDKKKSNMPSISSSDVNIQLTNQLTLNDILTSTENKDKSLYLEDTCGYWVISHDGRLLTRKHKLIDYPDIKSYFATYDNDYNNIVYYLTNGQYISFKYQNDNIYFNSNRENMQIYKNWTWK